MLSMLGKKVLLRPPGDGNKTPEGDLVLFGFVVDYNDATHKATIVAYAPEGYQVTLHNVPHDEDLPNKKSRVGCWCHYSEMKIKIDIPSEQEQTVPVEPVTSS